MRMRVLRHEHAHSYTSQSISSSSVLNRHMVRLTFLHLNKPSPMADALARAIIVGKAGTERGAGAAIEEAVQAGRAAVGSGSRVQAGLHRSKARRYEGGTQPILVASRKLAAE
eukprot:6205103-Pleurochrysis_carterae.AAC.4